LDTPFLIKRQLIKADNNQTNYYFHLKIYICIRKSNRMLKLKISTLTLLSALLFSCGSNEENIEETAQSDSLAVSTDSVKAEAEAEDEKSFSLPSPLQVAYVFKKSGAGYNASLISDDANASKYNTSNFKRAANFGIYSSDLAYCIFNKKSQDAKDYLKACKILGEALGLNQAFESDNMAQRFDKNIGNEDSIVKLVSGLQLKTDALLEQNKQRHISVIAFTGAWIESMYIASEIYAKEKNKKVLASLLEQLSFSETVIKALSATEKADTEITGIIPGIKELDTKFNSIPSIKNAFENDEDIDFQKIVVDESELNAIKTSIKELRTKLVN
jgi:hypothetical protein